jgi:hypothetical protein
MPTIVRQINARELYGPSEGYAFTKFGTVALTQLSASEDEPRGHYAALVGPDLIDSGRTRLQGLDGQ